MVDIIFVLVNFLLPCSYYHEYLLFMQVTYHRMKDALVQLSKGVQKGPAADLVPVLFGERQPALAKKDISFTPFNTNLDHSQVCNLISCMAILLVIFLKVLQTVVIYYFFHGCPCLCN